MDEEITLGGYVTGVPYREMRLKILLTGTNAPTEEAWAAALGNLLEELPRLRKENAELKAGKKLRRAKAGEDHIVRGER